METDQIQEPEEPKQKSLPIDFRAIAIGIFKKLPILLVCVAAAAYVGNKEAKKYGKKTYKSETLVRFERHGEVKPETDEKTTILTLKDTVKTERNLTIVKEILGLKEPLPVIGKALDVQVQKNTTLMDISATWKTPDTAADMANTLRDVFLKQYRSGTKSVFANQVKDLASRLQEVTKQIQAADSNLQKFTTANHLIDIDKQSRALLEESNSMSVLLEQAQADRQTVEEQSAKLDRVVTDLKDKVAKEQNTNASLESLSDLNIRIGKLKESIREDKEYRANVIEMSEKQDEMERAKKLMQMGAISQLEYQRAVAAFDKAKVAAQDTDQIKGWRQELDKLQKVVIPKDGVLAPSGPILQEMLIKTFDIQLQRVAVQERVASLSRAYKRVKDQLERIPDLQRQYDILNRNVLSLTEERKSVEERLAVMKRASEAETPDFSPVTEASAERSPVSSSSKMIKLGIIGGGAFAGLLIVLILEFMDTTIRTGREVEIRMKTVLIGEMQNRRRGALFTSITDRKQAETDTLMAQKVRQLLPRGEPTHLLLVSATGAEGIGEIGANLAACFGRQGERCLFVDMLSAGAEQAALKPLTEGTGVDGRLLQAFLAGDKVDVDAIAKPSTQQGVSVISRCGEPISPDHLSSNRMGELIEGLKTTYPIIITVASPIEDSMEPQLLSRFADKVVFVTRSRKNRGSKLRSAIGRMEAAGAAVSGAILIGMQRIYMSKE